MGGFIDKCVACGMRRGLGFGGWDLDAGSGFCSRSRYVVAVSGMRSGLVVARIYSGNCEGGSGRDYTGLLLRKRGLMGEDIGREP